MSSLHCCNYERGVLLELSHEAKQNMKQIQALENKYGLIVLRAGLTHLVDFGHSNFTDDAVEKGIKQILADGEADEANGVRSFMTPEFKCEIVRCSAELAKFTIWTLFAYVKKYQVIDI